MPDVLPITPLSMPFRAVMRPPGSKSLTNRALLLAALAEGTSQLTEVLFSDDTRHMMTALQSLGFDLDIDESSRTVTVAGSGGVIPAKHADLFLGNAGTATRFLTAACCLGPPGSEYTITGVPRMHQRPIGQLVDALRQLDAKIEYPENDSYPPLKVYGGGLTGYSVRMNPSVSSQFVSALMLIGPLIRNGLRLTFAREPVSKPYIMMTDDLMRMFGAEVAPESTRARTVLKAIDIPPERYRDCDLEIEPDASAASYFFATAAIIPNAKVRVPGLHTFALQGDAAFSQMCLAPMGASVAADSRNAFIHVTGTERLTGIDINLNDIPDMAQTLAVVALFAEGETIMRNVGNLRVKETDRMAAIKNECEKLGATVSLTEHDIHITPPTGNVLRHPDGEPISETRPVTIDTYDDHRMAMSFAVAGLRQSGMRIADPDCVNKTYPDFFAHLATLANGGNVRGVDVSPSEPESEPEVER